MFRLQLVIYIFIALFFLSIRSVTSIESSSWYYKSRKCKSDEACNLSTLRTRGICISGYCQINPSFFSFNWNIYIATCGALILGALAGAAGIGGGGLLVPLFVFTLMLQPHDAIPISKATIFGGAVANYAINFSSNHPTMKRRLRINYEMVMIMEPMTLAGTVIGVHMNKVFPAWVITVALSLLLIMTSYKTLAKARKFDHDDFKRKNPFLHDIVSYWKNISCSGSDQPMESVVKGLRKWKASTISNREKNRIKGNQNLESIDGYILIVEEDPAIHTTNCKLYSPSWFRNPLLYIRNVIISKQPHTLEQFYIDEGKIPIYDLSVLSMVWITLVCLNAIKGGESGNNVSGITCGSAAYWLVVSLNFPIMLVVTGYYSIRAVERQKIKEILNYPSIEGDIRWDANTTLRYAPVCLVAGIAAGLLGIGGGMIKGPLMLVMGILPQVATATSSFMILFTSSATTFQFMIFGMLRIEYACWFCGVGFISSYLGRRWIRYLIEIYQSTSVILYVLSLCIGSSAIIMTVMGVIEILHNGLGRFHSICQ